MEATETPGEQSMKTLGMIGGIGPESTIEYYRQLIAAYQIQKPDGSYPPIIINSVNLKALLDLFEANDLTRVTERLVVEIQKLAAAGAEYGLLAANTPHIVFDEIRRLSPIPLISIVEATCEAARASGLKRLGLFGTRFTMQSQFYPKVFSPAQIALVVPQAREQTYIHDKYMNELVKGIIRPETRQQLLLIADRLIEQEGIDGLILGGTELPLILGDVADPAVPFLDTTHIHVQAAVAWMMS
jgi:aspartate racemase